ncbi:DNA polymerase III subunit beta [Candidatus Azambacteria bacterium]|nr:DNA polymerase III subunit beta [Candidatus Azambacteria bacterium]
MKLICNQENLKIYLNILERISSKNINLPIISNILLEADNNNLNIKATDLELALEININCKTEESGKVTISTNLLSSFVNNLPNGNIELESFGKNLKITCNNFNAMINGQEPEDFPIFPKINKEKSEKLYFPDIKNGLLKLINIVPINNIRPEILGVLLKPDGENFKIVATDSFRLGEVTINKKLNFNEPFIIPLKTTQEIIKIFENSEIINIAFSQNQIIFFNEKITFISKLIDGEYPNYQSIIPKKFETTFCSTKDELIRLVKAVSPFLSKSNEMSLMIEKKLLKVKASHPEKGEGFSSLNIQVEGEPLEVKLNYRFFLDGLNNISEKEVFLGFGSSTSPAIIKSRNDPNYIYIIMPIRG